MSPSVSDLCSGPRSFPHPHPEWNLRSYHWSGQVLGFGRWRRSLVCKVDLSDGWWAPSPVILSFWPQVSHIKRCSASSLPGSWGPRSPRRQPCEDSWALAGAPPGWEIPSATGTLAEAGVPVLHGTSLGSLFLCLQTPSQPNHGGASGLSGQDAHLTWGWPLALPAEAPAPRMHQKLQSQWGGPGLGVKSWPLTLPSLNCAEEQGQDADSGMRLLGAFAWTLLHPPAWNVHWPHGVAPRLEEINPFVGLPLLHVLIPGLELHL